MDARLGDGRDSLGHGRTRGRASGSGPGALEPYGFPGPIWPATASVSARWILVTRLAGFVVTFPINAPALHGSLISDDLFLVRVPEVQALALGHVLAIRDPRGDLARTLVNYAPVHVLLHAMAISVIGDRMPGHHGLGAARHALRTALLACFFVEMGLPRRAALFASRSVVRANVFRRANASLIEAAVHDPDGSAAHVQRARGFARAGEAGAELCAAGARGWRGVGIVFLDRDFAPVPPRPHFPEIWRDCCRPRR